MSATGGENHAGPGWPKPRLSTQEDSNGGDEAIGPGPHATGTRSAALLRDPHEEFYSAFVKVQVAPKPAGPRFFGGLAAHCIEGGPARETAELA
ncbi:hypothetical protein PSP31121_04759 [Pandoraea sputorum]|uniref:Uncharacterized protein n=1 Tax=Pandoraea sputorum TaxID=93222 RepID=A0A5E5BE00_9BURK|nr:hypothetical protein PSP31121_04759 [Pandoraea sputorum]